MAIIGAIELKVHGLKGMVNGCKIAPVNSKYGI
jgi:hypothetical protein